MYKRDKFKKFFKTMKNKAGSAFVGTMVKVIIAVVIGAITLGGLYVVADNSMDSAKNKVSSLFEVQSMDSGSGGSEGSGTPATPVGPAGATYSDGGFVDWDTLKDQPNGGPANSTKYVNNSVSDYAFLGDESLVSVVIPDGTTSIGASAFQNCTSLTSITIPNSVTSIGSSAFSSCTSLTSITIPNGVTTIGSSAFESCTSLTSVTIPDSTKDIGSQAFGYCSSLKSVVIPDGAKTGDLVFRDCSELTSVTMPNVMRDGNNALPIFDGCSKLSEITFKGNRNEWSEFYSAYSQGAELKNITVYCSDGTITL